MSDHQPLAALPFPYPSLTARLRPPGAVRAVLHDRIALAWAHKPVRLRHAGYIRGWRGWLGVALLRARVALLALPSITASTTSSGGLSGAGGAGGGGGEWVALLPAVVCTLAIVALFLAPVWLPGWRRWRAVRRRRRWARGSTAEQAAQRFAEAVARGDFQTAETEAERLLNLNRR